MRLTQHQQVNSQTFAFGVLYYGQSYRHNHHELALNIPSTKTYHPKRLNKNPLIERRTRSQNFQDRVGSYLLTVGLATKASNDGSHYLAKGNINSMGSNNDGEQYR